MFVKDLHWYQKAASPRRHGETVGRRIQSIQVHHKDAGGRRSRPRHDYTIRFIATLGIASAYHTIAHKKSL